jgi:subtilisin family serine protease
VGAVFDADIGTRTYSSGAQMYSSAADRITPFSQRHAVLSEIFAPGAAITGASNSSSGTKTFHGTSQASPHVAGATVLAQQIAEQYLGRRLSLAEFRGLLAATGVIVNDGDDEDDNVSIRA